MLTRARLQPSNLLSTTKRSIVPIFAIAVLTGLAGPAFAASPATTTATEVVSNVVLPPDDERTTAKTAQSICEACHFPEKNASFHLANGKGLMEATAEEMIANSPPYLTTGPTELARPRPDNWQELVYFGKDVYHGSAHGEMYCIDCHDSFNSSEHKPLPHAQYLPPANCHKCHPEEKEWLISTHGQAANSGDTDAPTCAKCHDENFHEMKLGEYEFHDAPIKAMEKCISCHGDEDILKRHENLKQDAVATYEKTIHHRGVFSAGLEAATCVSCHTSHKVMNHEVEESSTFAANTYDTCGECHEVPSALVKGSIHGEELAEGNAEAPGCSGCHKPHGEIQVLREEFQTAIVPTCGECHNKEGMKQLDSYLESYHGKAASHGSMETANCADCHSFHDLHEPSSEKSTVNEANLVETCKECHPYSDEKWVTFMPHVHPGDPGAPPKIRYPYIFMICLLIGTMGFFVVHSLLWLIREFFELGKRKKMAGHVGPMYQRFNLTHRITHAILFISVIGLAVTGMPLRYPTHEWSQWLMKTLGGVTVAGWLHRIFAALTLLYAGIHFVYLFKIWRKAEKKPFFKWVFGPNSMIPNWTDIKQFFQHVLYFFGLQPMPKFGRWAYWEKFDYWAVFWGVVIIGLSGIVMAFSGFFARILPGWMFNVMLLVHSDEALLAASFLFAIHFFHVHLRPVKFPMDHVMFTGSVNRAEMEEERVGELEELESEGKLEGLEVAAPNPTQLVVNRVIAAVALAIGLAMLVALVYSEIVVRLLGKG